MHERTPNLQNHEARLRWLEKHLPLAMEDISDLKKFKREQQMDSSADLSVHPGRLRVSLKNLPPWVYIVAFLALEGAALAFFLAMDRR